MNNQALENTAVAIEKGKDTFRMRNYVNDCGTPACVCGFVLFANMSKKKFAAINVAWNEILANRILGLSKKEATRMFRPTFVTANFKSLPYEKGHITADMAVEMLRRAQLTQKVTWW